ncbi:DUF4892 domain-containing protein [Thiopseudomonas denitrificans]|uniref:Uncharacterized protein DUF4892 n=1 Tax=Thiopseudomonas denitrificans TaxID=1501432 RepID=A0A4R6U590_9GAMM|nr:DUF4892 domain-containing protein [Thiopseudomonas denitrificans]TDQ39993.1 uncharacterized protein DUF4892 [Thiopseudomonas denitrificans]
MTIRIGFLFAVVSTLYAGPLAAAQTVLDAVSQLPSLVDSRLLEQTAGQPAEKIYPLGSVRRISGQLRFSDELTVRGERHRATWQLSAVHAADSAFTQGRELLQAAGARLLYWCQGRDCGPSNLWANAVFDNARLYGPDERQLYALLAGASGQELFALYAVTRGNGRGMLHVEQFMTDELPDGLYPAAATLLLQLQTDQRLELTGNQGEIRAEIPQLARALNRDSSLRVVLSGAQAASWREQLVSAGVRATRMELGEETGAATRMDVLP